MAKAVFNERLCRYRVAIIDDDGDRFLRMRTADPWAGSIEHMSLEEAALLAGFLNEHLPTVDKEHK